MAYKPPPSPSPQALVRRALDNIKQRPKLNYPDKDGIPADVPLQAQHDPKFAKQIMGFREWCEKVWDKT